jgi:PAS domain-containing protein
MVYTDVHFRTGQPHNTSSRELPIMIDQSSAALRQTAPRHDIFSAAANFMGAEQYGSLMLDRLGRILSCGALAENMFGAGRGRLMGRWISDFISGLLLGGNSPSYNARYLVHLCADGEWRKFEAKDASGLGFTVELNLSRMLTGGQENFLLNVRLPESTLRS